MRHKVSKAAFGAIGLSIMMLGVSAAGWGSHVQAAVPPASKRANTVPHFKHVFVIMMENHSYADIMNEHDVPYIHYLARHYGLAAQYYGITNPSAPDRVGLLSGRIDNLELPGVSGHNLPQPNLIDQLVHHHISWGAFYQHSMTSSAAHPYYGYQHGHSTFLRFRDIANNPARIHHLHTLRTLTQDLKSNTVPQFVWIAPNSLGNMEGPFRAQGAGLGATAADRTIEQDGNNFLQQMVGRIMHSQAWRSGPSAIFIQFDETSFDASMPQDGLWASYKGVAGSPVVPKGTVLEYSSSKFPFPGGVDGGGHALALVITNPPHHVVSTTPYNEYSVLRTIEKGWHLRLLGHAGQPGVHSMAAFFHHPPAFSPSKTSRLPLHGTSARFHKTPIVAPEHLTVDTTANGSATALSPAYFTEGTSGQAAAALRITPKAGLWRYPHSVVLSLPSSSPVQFTKTSHPVGATSRIQNPGMSNLPPRYGPSTVMSHQIVIPLAPLSGATPASLYVSGLEINVPQGTPAGAVPVTVSYRGAQIATTVLGTVGRPAPHRSAPVMLAPEILPGQIRIRFEMPQMAHQGQLYKVRLMGVNPESTSASQLTSNQYYAFKTPFNVVTIPNQTAHLTPLAAKL